MKPIVIIVIAFVLLIPINAFSISVSEIEKKMLQAQSREDIDVIMEESFSCVAKKYRQLMRCDSLFF